MPDKGLSKKIIKPLKVQELLLYFMVFFAISGWYGMWYLLTDTFFSIDLAQKACYLLIGIIAVLGNKIKKGDILYSGIVVVYLLFYLAVTSFYNYKNFLLGFVLVTFCSYFLCANLVRRNQIKVLALAYCNVMYFFAVISLICWLFGSVLGVLPGRILTHYNWANTTYNTYTYFFLYFENPVQAVNMFGHLLIRNTGIFTEAPGYASALTLALGIELFWPEFRKNKRYKWIIIVTLLTTLSTKGFIVLGILLVISIVNYIKEKGNRNKGLKFIGFVLFVLISIGVVYIIRIIMYDKMSTQSYGIRYDDLISCIKTWITHPFFGVGYGNVSSVLENSGIVYRKVQSISMGLLVVLAEGGLYLLAFYALPAILVFRIIPKKLKLNYLFFLVLIFVDALTSHIMFTPKILILTMLAYNLYFYNKMEKKEEKYRYDKA